MNNDSNVDSLVNEKLARRLSLAVFLCLIIAILCFPITIILAIICVPCCICYLCFSAEKIKYDYHNKNNNNNNENV